MLRNRYTDSGGVETTRVEPQHVVVGPNGSYLTAWCHLRQDDRAFRMDRITQAERTPSLPGPRHVPPEPAAGEEVKASPTLVVIGRDEDAA